MKRTPTRPWRWLTRVLLVVVAALAVTWWWTLPPAPDDFYSAPRPLPAGPGTLVRSETFTRGVPGGARAWRILYTTTRADGSAAVASGIVLAPAAAASGAREVIAWTHGTTGVAPACAPSLLPHPFANVPALEQALDEGWTVVATDYVGLGTQGPHPYLIGEGQARSALDAIRAARSVDGAQAGTRSVVWGHSQGGHAALWTGILAPTYAPDAGVVAVVAAAPASNLPELIRAIAGTTVGRIMTSYALTSYAAQYPEVRFEDYTPAATRWLARDMARRCLDGRRALFPLAEALVAQGAVVHVPDAPNAFDDRLRENVPDRDIDVPVLVAQGESDDLVLPRVQQDWVRARCAAGQALDYRTYGGEDHLSLVAPDSAFIGDLVEWTRARFSGAAPDRGCART